MPKRGRTTHGIDNLSTSQHLVPKRGRNLGQRRRNLSAGQWKARIGPDSVTVYSPTQKRDAYLTQAEAHLLSIPAIQIGWRVPLRRLLPLTMYRSVSGLWRASSTLTSLGLMRHRIINGITSLQATVRTLVTSSSNSLVVRTDDRFSRVRTAGPVTVGDVLSRLYPGARVGLDRLEGIIEGSFVRVE